jgi:translation initiation factor IF-2
MNISTLAKLLGVSINELRDTGTKKSIYGFYGRNTRIPYNSAIEITKLLRPDKLSKITNDDKIYLGSSISVSEFAETINKPVAQVLKTLMLSGVVATMNEKIDFDTASLIASELNVEVFSEDGADFETGNTGFINPNDQLIKVIEYEGEESEKTYVKRPPVVTVMGHVDHGKTTLLDTIRKTNVVGGEAGSITQHISSYQIDFKSKEDDKLHKITFIDTPGHAAFTAMRARGSQLADFIILMVSAVEGPKPQTVEVIERAKINKTPVLVALNKIDLPDSDLERVKTEISKYGLVPEEWGGDTPFIPISAKTGENVDKLLETILMYAEINELTGQINCPGQAVVIESHLDTQLGVVTTVLVNKGEIKTGDVIRTGETVTRVRKLQSTTGETLTSANVGLPVVLLGMSNVINIGEAIIVYPTAKEANIDASKIVLQNNQNRRAINISAPIATGEKAINVVLKADVLGSLEALKEAIIKIPQDQVKIIIKSESVGAVNDNDVEFAQTTESTILVFHTDIPSKLENAMKVKKINFVQSDIIYQILEWVEEQILANTKHETKQVKIGEAQVLGLFKSEKPSIQVFGGQCTSGKLQLGKEFKVVRDGRDVAKLEILEIQRNKVKATEVIDPQQFGMSVKAIKGKIQLNDTIVCYDEIMVK